LLVLDPLVQLHGIDENRASEVAELLAYIRSLQRSLSVSVLLVHHTRKNFADGAAAGQGLRGSSDIHAFGDSNHYLQRTKEHFMLSSEHRSAPASAPVYLELVATDAETTHLDVVAELHDQNGRDLKERVLDLLARGDYADKTARLTIGQKRAARRGVGFARAGWPGPPHAWWLATSPLIVRGGPFRSPIEGGTVRRSKPCRHREWFDEHKPPGKLTATSDATEATGTSSIRETKRRLS
jgi:hypothetical protein